MSLILPTSYEGSSLKVGGILRILITRSCRPMIHKSKNRLRSFNPLGGELDRTQSGHRLGAKTSLVGALNLIKFTDVKPFFCLECEPS